MRNINRSIYAVKFEHPDHGYFHKLIMMPNEIELPASEASKDEIKSILSIYNDIVDIEPILTNEDITCI